MLIVDADTLHRFWDSLADWAAWTAISTLLLALVTFFLVLKTRELAGDAAEELKAIREQGQQVAKQATATEALAATTAQQAVATEELAKRTARHAEVAAEALELALWPYLIPGGAANSGEEPRKGVGLEFENHARVEVPIKNAGSGPARIKSARASTDELIAMLTFPPAAIEPGGTVSLVAIMPEAKPDQDLLIDDVVNVAIAYEGVREPPRELRFKMTLHPGGRWVIEISGEN